MTTYNHLALLLAAPQGTTAFLLAIAWQWMILLMSALGSRRRAGARFPPHRRIAHLPGARIQRENDKSRLQERD